MNTYFIIVKTKGGRKMTYKLNILMIQEYNIEVLTE